MKTMACVLVLCFVAPGFSQMKLSHDFRGGKFDEDLVRISGPKDKVYVTPEPEGLRLRYVGKDAAPQNNPAGIYSTFKARGNFVVTGSYEILKMGEPAKGTNGVGVEIYLMLDNPSRDGVGFARTLNFQSGAAIYFNVRTNDAAGKRISKDWRGNPTTDRSLKGRLRLAREGSVVMASIAEGDDEQFQEFQRSEIGNADIRLFRFNGHSGDDRNAVLDMRLLDFQLEGRDLSNDGRFATPRPKLDGAQAQGEAPQAAQPLAPVVLEQAAPGRSLLLLAVVFFMLAIPLLAIVGVVIFVRLRKPKSADMDSTAAKSAHASGPSKERIKAGIPKAKPTKPDSD